MWVCTLRPMFSNMCFSETWLTSGDQDIHVEVDGYELFRGDRTIDSNKVKGGGVCFYINNKIWCNPKNCVIKRKLCTPDIELLTVSTRHYYLPREFTYYVFITCVYIPP